MTMNNGVKKLNNKGLTLVELLVTIVILMLVTAMIALAIDFGVRSFNKSNRQAEGQILCATLSTSIKDELRYAKNITGTPTGTDPGTLKFFSTNNSIKNCSFSVIDESGTPASDGGFIVLSKSKGEPGEKNYDLVPKKTYVYDLKAKFTKFEYDDAASPKPRFEIGIQVLTENDEVISEEEFVVEPLNE